MGLNGGNAFADFGIFVSDLPVFPPYRDILKVNRLVFPAQFFDRFDEGDYQFLAANESVTP